MVVEDFEKFTLFIVQEVMNTRFCSLRQMVWRRYSKW